MPSSSSTTTAATPSAAAQALFVDITFDLLLFPTEVVEEGRTLSCHVLKKSEFWQDEIEKLVLGAEGYGVPDNDEEEEESIALSVGIRFGAIVAMANDGMRNNDEKMIETIEGNAANSKDGDGYQYYYQRGDNGFAVSDLDKYCRSIDIVLEDMDSADVANIMGDALLDDGCNVGVVAPSAAAASGGTKAIEESSLLTSMDHSAAMVPTQPSKHLNWQLSVHHKSLEANGILPLSSGSGGMGELITSNVLDMTLLQYNYDSRNDGSCFAVPKEEALKLWRKIDPTIVRAVEKPVAPSPKKMSPRKEVVTVDAAVAAATAAVQKKQEGGAMKEKKPVRRPPKPQETALFARGKRTTLGGSRRKKPKFRLGPA